jgi:putative FmdB family regulatory protein
MPMYQYACADCGQAFEKKLSMSQSGEQQECPGCGSRETRKRLGAVAVGGQRQAGAMPPPPVRRSPFS